MHGISSDLHMTPHEIAPAVEAKLKALLPAYERVIVVYGDCGTGGRLDEVLARYPGRAPRRVPLLPVVRGRAVPAVRGRHRHLLPDRLARNNWDRAVIKGLGIDRFPFTKDAYFGNITRILFVRQHPDPDREAKAREIAAWMGKPLEIHDLGIGPLDDLLTPLWRRSSRWRFETVTDTR